MGKELDVRDKVRKMLVQTNELLNVPAFSSLGFAVNSL